MSDLALFKSTGTAVLNPVLFTDVKVVDGLTLLTQRFIALLLREYDAVFDRGTSLLAQVRGGAMSGPSMRALATLAVVQAAQQMPVGATDTETLAAASVVAVTRNADRISISLTITSKAAQTATTTATVRTA